MSAIKLLKYGYLAFFSKPKADRLLYKVIRRVKPRSIVEVGIGAGVRTKRLLEQVLEHHPATDVRFAGIDLFEARSAERPGLSLKQAHATFKPLGVKLQFIPGDPFSALSRAANGLLQTDLLILSAELDPAAMQRAWMFVPRMLHDHSLVYKEELVEGTAETQFRLLERAEVESLAQKSQRDQRRAA